MEKSDSPLRDERTQKVLDLTRGKVETKARSHRGGLIAYKVHPKGVKASRSKGRSEVGLARTELESD